MRGFLAIVYLFSISDCIAALIGAIFIRGISGVPLIKRVGVVLAAVSLEQAMQLAAAGFSPLHGIRITTGYAAWVIAGRLIRSLAIWSLVLHLIGVRMHTETIEEFPPCEENPPASTMTFQLDGDTTTTKPPQSPPTVPPDAGG